MLAILEAIREGSTVSIKFFNGMTATFTDQPFIIKYMEGLDKYPIEEVQEYLSIIGRVSERAVSMKSLLDYLSTRAAKVDRGIDNAN